MSLVAWTPHLTTSARVSNSLYLSPSLPFTLTVAAGLYSGYLVYDEIHYWIHHGHLPWEWLRRLKTHHMAHHYAHPNENFGVSNVFTDIIFGTLRPSDNNNEAGQTK